MACGPTCVGGRLLTPAQGQVRGPPGRHRGLPLPSMAGLRYHGALVRTLGARASHLPSMAGPTVPWGSVGQRYPEITGFVLAGGSSKRMGRSKAHLLIGHETMVERQIHLLRSLCRSVAVLGPPEAFKGISVPVFTDTFPVRGPLAALYTGLLRTHSEYNLFLGCDLPFMSVRFSATCASEPWKVAPMRPYPNHASAIFILSAPSTGAGHGGASGPLS